MLWTVSIRAGRRWLFFFWGREGYLVAAGGFLRGSQGG